MKYLYPYECEKRGLSNPNELQAAIDSNRREGRRQSFGSSLFAYSPGGAHGMLSSPKLPVSSLGLAASTNGSSIAPAPKIKKGKGLDVSSGCVAWRRGPPPPLSGDGRGRPACQFCVTGTHSPRPVPRQTPPVGHGILAASVSVLSAWLRQTPPSVWPSLALSPGASGWLGAPF